MKPTGRYCFCLFHSQDPKPKRNHQIASSRAKTRSRRSQTCVKYWGNIICILRKNRCEQKWSEITSQKKRQNKVDFQGLILNFSKKKCVSPSILCMAGELLTSRFIWHQDIRVTHCQSSAMSFIFTQYSFCNSFIHGLLGSWNFERMFLWHYVSSVTCHVSCVMCHVSRVMCHV